MASETVLTTRPYPALTKCGHAARVTKTVPMKWTSIIVAELLGGQRLEHARIVDAGVVDHRVDTTERVESGVDDGRRVAFVGDRRVARDRLATGLFDLAHDVICRGGRANRAPSMPTP